jgi:palmitoyl-protein thioesterase
MLRSTACLLIVALASAAPFVAEQSEDDMMPLGVPFFEGAVVEPSLKGSKYPTVTAHGMGDSCFNSGMKQITEMIATRTGQYGVCVPTGNRLTDTTNGFFMTMNKNVDVFAEKIRKDPKLANGFNCVGFSQGNSVCRGYIQKYNDPPVITFLSVHGTVSGVAGFPNCNPSGLLGPVCKPLARLCGDASYTELTQGLLFQIDYFRDPMRVNSDAYKKTSQLAQWNNEGDVVNATFKENFGKVKRFAMIKAEKDTMVFPNEGEWWGHFEDGSQSKVLTMKETKWYKDDLFGLRTADEAGKILFNSTTGNHLQFTTEELMYWVDNYFVE